ncbi:MAG: hypothetical protein WDO74_32590 [Pseudomonadota bacterium]
MTAKGGTHNWRATSIRKQAASTLASEKVTVVISGRREVPGGQSVVTGSVSSINGGFQCN